MNIASIDIEGFRAFTEKQSFDLDADIILFTGANGRGKTSLFDAVLWCLTGSLPRIEMNTEDASIISLYSDSRQARVEVTLHKCIGEDSASVNIIRSGDSENSELSVRTSENGAALRGGDATYWLLNELWPQAQAAEKAPEAFSRALTRSVYLQQDLVRQFVEADDEKERYNAVGELIGLGRFTELNKKLDTQRKKWKKSLNENLNTAEELRADFEAAKSRLNSLKSSTQEDLGELREKWSGWWSISEKLGVELKPPAVEASNAASVLENGIQSLRAVKRSKQRSAKNAISLLEEIEEFDDKAEPPDIQALSQEVDEASVEKEEAMAKLSRTREAAAKRREVQIRQQERAAELATLAKIALRYVDGECPVCTQAHDEVHTRDHLQELIEQVGSDGFRDSDVEDTGEQVDAAIAQLKQKEKALSEARVAHKAAVQEQQYREELLSELESWAEQASVAATEFHELETAVRGSITSLESETEQIDSHIERGKSLSLRLANVSQESMYEETQDRVTSLQSELEAFQDEIDSKQRASEIADVFVEEIENATKDYVVDRLDSVSNLLQQIYTKVDPHPTFRSIRLTPHFAYRRGRLNPFVFDPHFDIRKQDPFGVMSSSQINVVALSIFLALNLGIPTVPLKTLMLDDPLQSLDDINLLGLIDLIRRSRAHRQIFLSTHDSRLIGLLKQKLRPVEKNQRTRVIEFKDWTRNGPETVSVDLRRDQENLRLVAA